MSVLWAEVAAPGLAQKVHLLSWGNALRSRRTVRKALWGHSFASWQTWKQVVGGKQPSWSPVRAAEEAGRSGPCLRQILTWFLLPQGRRHEMLFFSPELKTRTSSQSVWELLLVWGRVFS